MKKKLSQMGFLKVGAATPSLRVGDIDFNVREILSSAKEAATKGVEIVSFPELCITGYTAGDLFQQRIILEKAKKGLEDIVQASKSISTVLLVGLPYEHDEQVFNVAAVVSRGKLFGLVPKTFIPNYGEFYEKRWFSSSKSLRTKTAIFLGQTVAIDSKLIFTLSACPQAIFGVEICEDVWAPIPPSTHMGMAGAKIIFNLSASNELVGKAAYRKTLVMHQSACLFAGYILTSSGVDESTTDVVYSGHAIIAENGLVLNESKRFIRKGQLITSQIDLEHIASERGKKTSFSDGIGETGQEHFTTIEVVSGGVKTTEVLERYIDPHPFVPSDRDKRNEICNEIFSIQSTGLITRMERSAIKKLVIGVSGGLDSALALLVAVKTMKSLSLPASNILAFSMPGFGTTSRTGSNAKRLCEHLGVIFEEVSINRAINAHFGDIHQDIGTHDVTYENSQARYRTMLLMSKANQNKALVMGTGDLSEIALGWCTFSGDHISHYNVNASIPKTLVRYLINWIADTRSDEKLRLILEDITNTPISPELVMESEDTISQKTEDLIGPYELHDFFLYHFIRWSSSPKKILFLATHAFSKKYSRQVIKKWLKIFVKRFFANQWKRSVMPDGPKVGSVSLSPRGDWRMPSDADGAMWLRDLDME